MLTKFWKPCKKAIFFIYFALRADLNARSRKPHATKILYKIRYIECVGAKDKADASKSFTLVVAQLCHKPEMTGGGQRSRTTQANSSTRNKASTRGNCTSRTQAGKAGWDPSTQNEHFWIQCSICIWIGPCQKNDKIRNGHFILGVPLQRSHINF